MPDNNNVVEKTLAPYGTYQFAKVQHFLLLMEAEDTDYIWQVDALGNATLILYYGTKTKIKVPRRIGGYRVRYIDCVCFSYNTNITSVTIPEGIISIG